MTIQEAMEDLGRKGVILTSTGEDLWLAIQMPKEAGGRSTIIARGKTWKEVYRRVTGKPEWRLREQV